MPLALLEDDSPWVQKFREAPEKPKEDKAISVINQAGIDLIKRFEGLRLEAYVCPAGVLTIGYGSTGDHVYPGQVITEPEAEELLRKDLWRFEDCVSNAVKVPLTDNEYAALVSFTFNVGCGALKDSTLLKRLNAGEPKSRVFSEELPRWNKGAGAELEGLTRRRQAEVDLALSGSVPADTLAFKPSSPFSQNITPHFTYGELTLCQEERRFTNQGQCDIALQLCQFLEKARAKFGPLKITSGHRPPAVNTSVGGATNSEHLYKPHCGAVDVYPIDGDGMEFERWCDKNWEYSVGYGMNYRGFVHLGIRADGGKHRWDY